MSLLDPIRNRTTSAARRAVTCLLAAVALQGFCSARQLTPQQSLHDAIQRLVDQAGLGNDHWALRVLELPSRTPVYEYAPQAGLVPASNQKLATTAAAFVLLGPDFEFQTVLARSGNDLVVIGGGDPLTGDPLLAEMRNVSPEQLFLDWAEALIRKGLTRFDGDLLVDDTIFDGQTVHPNWPADQRLRWYEAPVAGLNYNNNCLDVWVWPTQPGKPVGYRLRPQTDYVQIVNDCLTGGRKRIKLILDRPWGTNRIRLSGRCPVKMVAPQSITVHDPAMFFATCLRETLAGQGIEVTGTIRRRRFRTADGTIPPNLQTLAVHRTPIAKVLWRANARSLNMVAECLLKMLAVRASARVDGRPVQGNWPAGCRAVAGFLESIGIPPNSFLVDDGSGMSRRNVATVYALTQILAYMFDRPRRNRFIDSLAVAGKTGTLRRRLASKRTRGKVFGKTGTLRGVSSLSGYVEAESGTWFCFSMIFNNATGPRRARCRRFQDRLCELLAQYRP